MKIRQACAGMCWNLPLNGFICLVKTSFTCICSPNTGQEVHTCTYQSPAHRASYRPPSRLRCCNSLWRCCMDLLPGRCVCVCVATIKIDWSAFPWPWRRKAGEDKVWGGWAMSTRAEGFTAWSSSRGPQPTSDVVNLILGNKKQVSKLRGRVRQVEESD